MGALSALVLWLAAGVPESPCFAPSDQTAGWKRVVLPDEAPALAAPADVDQFRSGEPALVVEQDVSAHYTGPTRPNLGRMRYHFRVPSGTQRLEIGFAEDLRGAKVDAVVYRQGHGIPLLDERRKAGTSLVLEWTLGEVERVEVSVHHHLRDTPVVSTWRVTRRLEPGLEPRMTPAFRAPRSLYYRHPGGGRWVMLCDAPGREPRLTRWPDEHPVLEVTLARP